MNELNHSGLKDILVAPWSRVAATRDLPTIAFFRAGVLLRRSVPVTRHSRNPPARGDYG